MSDNCNAPVKDAEVNIALDEQLKAIEILQDAVSRLWTKLIPVLRDEPKNDKCCETKVESAVPLVRDINVRTRKIKEESSRLRDFCNLCEL